MTVLDQKAKGVTDPILYTREEMESALEAPRPEPSFTSPGWRRKLSWGTYLTAQSPNDDVAKIFRKGARTPTIPGSPMVHPSQGESTRLASSSYSQKLTSRAAIGWSLTGTMNSPSTNVAVMYSSENSNSRDPKLPSSKPPPPASSQPSIASLISEPPVKFEPPQQPLQSPSIAHFNHSSMPPPPSAFTNTLPTPDPVLVSDADLLLNLHSPFSATSPRTSAIQSQTSFARASSQQPPPNQNDFSPTFGTYPPPSDNTFGDMVIDTQDVDMSLLGADMMPWDLEYLPHDMLYFGENGFSNSGMGENGQE
jgi:hypothetical protein